MKDQPCCEAQNRIIYNPTFMSEWQILDTGCLMLDKIKVITFKNQYPRPPRLKAKPMAGRQKPVSSIFSIGAIECVTNFFCHKIQKNHN
jgi:hypothetical protein